MWERVLASCWRAVLSLPIIPYPQGPAEGNIWESHVDTWNAEQVWGELGGILAGHVNEVTGCFVARGARERS